MVRYHLLFLATALVLVGSTTVLLVHADSSSDVSATTGPMVEGGGYVIEEVAKLAASDGGAWDSFGIAVDISGDVIVVSATSPWPYGCGMGAAYVFQKEPGEDGSWYEAKKLTADSVSSDRFFGFSVAAGDGAIAVGAVCPETGGGLEQVFVFGKEVGGPSAWGSVETLRPDDGKALFFGHGLSMSGSVVAVTASGDASDNGDWGSVHLFDRELGQSGGYGLAAKATDGEGEGNQFGSSAAIHGTTLAVGAPHDSTVAYRAGAVCVFEYLEGTWLRGTKLLPEDRPPMLGLGSNAMAVGADTIVAGAQANSDRGDWAGAAYVFGRDSTAADGWAQHAKVIGSNVSRGDHFGFATAIDGDVAAIGAYMDRPAGSVYLFGRDQGAPNYWGEIAKLTASDAVSNDWFGMSLAMDANVLIVGAPNRGESAGQVYVYEISTVTPTPSPSATATNTPTLTPTPTASPTPVQMSLSKTAEQGSVCTGETQRYTITLTNDSAGDLTDIEIADEIPTLCEALLEESSPGAKVVGQSVMWHYDSIPAGETRALTLTVRIPSHFPDGAALRNCVTASAVGGLRRLACVDTTVRQCTPTPTITATASPRVTRTPTVTPTARYTPESTATVTATEAASPSPSPTWSEYPAPTDTVRANSVLLPLVVRP